MSEPRTHSPHSVAYYEESIDVVSMQEARCGMINFNRHDLFKVVLVVQGANELHYATRSYVVDKPALVFTNRLIPSPGGRWQPTCCSKATSAAFRNPSCTRPCGASA